MFVNATASFPNNDALQAAAAAPGRDAGHAAAGDYPRGDGTFSLQASGIQPQPQLDLQLAMMANDTYVAANPQTEKALQDAGWNRLVANAAGTALLDAQGREIPIAPELLSTDNGFDAAIYQNDQGQYVVAYRGTDNWSLARGGDGDDNVLQSMGFESGQYSDAIKLAQRAEAVFGDGNVVLTGHSLGGGLAAAAALATGASGVSFNAAGLSDKTLESLGFNPNAVRDQAADSGQLRRYIVNGEPLNAAQQDLPLLSPPDAIGHELRVDPPAGMSPFDLGGLHGGGGDGASYVDALQQNTAWDPADRPTAPEQLGSALNTGIDAVGTLAGNTISGAGDTLGSAWDAAGSVLGRSPLPGDRLAGAALSGAGTLVREASDVAATLVDRGVDLVGDGVDTLVSVGGNIAGDVTHRASEFVFDTIGNGARHAEQLVAGASENFRAAGQQISRIIREDFASGDHVQGSLSTLGTVLDAGIDTVGTAAASTIGFAGDTVQNITTGSGGLLRDIGKELGLEQPANAVAGMIENAGNAVSNFSDRAGRVVDGAIDKIGDGVRATSDFVGKVAQGASNVAQRLNPLSWF